jgi:hypothetical protein
MKSLLLSAVLGLGTLGGLLASAAPAQGGPLLWFLVARRVVNGPPYVYRYYDGPVYGYYYGPYPAPAPAPAPEQAPAPTPAPAAAPDTVAAPAPVPQTWSADYGPGETGRYQYYTSNGMQMCFDRQTGQFWYQDRNTREWKRWSR